MGVILKHSQQYTRSFSEAGAGQPLSQRCTEERTADGMDEPSSRRLLFVDDILSGSDENILGEHQSQLGEAMGISWGNISLFDFFVIFDNFVSFSSPQQLVWWWRSILRLRLLGQLPAHPSELPLL